MSNQKFQSRIKNVLIIKNKQRKIKNVQFQILKKPSGGAEWRNRYHLDGQGVCLNLGCYSLLHNYALGKGSAKKIPRTLGSR